MLFLGLGGVLFLVGTIWFIVLSIQTGQTTAEKVIWTLVSLICQPIGGIVFFIMKKQGLVPLILVIIGAILTGVGNFSMLDEIRQQMPK